MKRKVESKSLPFLFVYVIFEAKKLSLFFQLERNNKTVNKIII